jgi:Zn-finger nucleic acid-binding protein
MVPVCPKCDVALLIVEHDDVEVDVCDRCRGVWLDAGELERLGIAPETTAVVAESSRYLCPRCDRPMRQIRRRGVELEECPAGHGVWLDAGELERLCAPRLETIFANPKQGG